MILARLSLVVASCTLLSACADPGMYPPSAGGYPPPTQPPAYEPPQPSPPPRGDYQPQLATEYRNGYDIGQRDASVGYPSDYHRAFERFGGGFESYFQEGYSDGYEGRGMQH